MSLQDVYISFHRNYDIRFKLFIKLYFIFAAAVSYLVDCMATFFGASVQII